MPLLLTIFLSLCIATKEKGSVAANSVSVLLSLRRRKNAGRFGQVAKSQKVVQSCKGKGLALLQIACAAVANDGARTPA